MLLFEPPRGNLRVLLLDVRLGATLQRLARVVLLLELLLLVAITRSPGDHASDCALHAVGDAFAEVGELPGV